MRKFSLLIGALGGATAGYLLSNKKLREELAGAKDAETAAKLLGKHLQRDGKKLAKQVQEFVESDEVKKNVRKAKDFTKKKVSETKEELRDLVSEGKAQATRAAKSAVRKGKAKAKKAVKTAKRRVTKRRK